MSAARRKLLDAAATLAQECRLEDLSAERIAGAAGVGVAEFLGEFGSVLTYVDTLQQSFLDEVRSRVVKVTGEVPPGLNRVKLAADSYLATCLEYRRQRAWFVDARAHAEVAASFRRQNQIYWVVIGAELSRLGWPAPQSAARLYLAMLNEAATLEQRAGSRLPEVREVLWDFLDGGPAGAPPA